MSTVTKTKTFKFELVTPEGVLINQEIDKLVAVTDTGEVGILINHADMTCRLASAPLRYSVQGKEELVAVLGGVLEMRNNKATLITDFAEKSTDIDEAEAHKAAERAKAELDTMKPTNPNQRDLVIAEYNLQKELLKLKTVSLRKNC